MALDDKPTDEVKADQKEFFGLLYRLLVDAERGIVWAHCVFDQGTVNEGVLSDGTKHKYAGFNRPGSILVSEAFLIEGGKIRRVEMIGPAAVYHMNSPWGGLSGD